MFRNGAVLQLGVPVTVWGNASVPAGQPFNVYLDGKVVTHGTVEAMSSRGQKAMIFLRKPNNLLAWPCIHPGDHATSGGGPRFWILAHIRYR